MTLWQHASCPTRGKLRRVLYWQGGRSRVTPGQRRGVELMQVGIAFCESRWNTGIRISGQGYLKGFYEALGFETIHGPYMEDDIPHYEMLKPGV